MSYDLHITRSNDWVESEENPISFEEWKKYIDNDPELTLTGFAETKMPNGQIIRMDNEGLALWEKKSLFKTIKSWFYYNDGQIQVSGPNEAVIKKMKTVASALSAKVIGDDGEEY